MQYQRYRSFEEFFNRDAWRHNADMRESWLWKLNTKGLKTQFRLPITCRDGEPVLEANFTTRQFNCLQKASYSKDRARLIGIPSGNRFFRSRAVFFGFELTNIVNSGGKNKNLATILPHIFFFQDYGPWLSRETKRRMDYRLNFLEAHVPGVGKWLGDDRVDDFQPEFEESSGIDKLAQPILRKVSNVGFKHQNRKYDLQISLKSAAKINKSKLEKDYRQNRSRQIVVETESLVRVDFGRKVDLFDAMHIYSCVVSDFFNFIFCRPHSPDIFSSDSSHDDDRWHIFLFGVHGKQFRTEDISVLESTIVDIDSDGVPGVDVLLRNWAGCYNLFGLGTKIYDLLALIRSGANEGVKFATAFSVMETAYMSKIGKWKHLKPQDILKKVFSYAPIYGLDSGLAARMAGGNFAIKDPKIIKKIAYTRNNMIHPEKPQRTGINYDQMTGMRFVFLVYIHLFVLERLGVEEQNIKEIGEDVLVLADAFYR